MTAPKPTSPPEAKADRKPPTLVLDWADWLSHLEGLDATEAEKRQLIETVWTIVVAFVDLGWEVAAEKTCGKDLDLAAALRTAVLNSPEKEDA